MNFFMSLILSSLLSMNFLSAENLEDNVNNPPVDIPVEKQVTSLSTSHFGTASFSVTDPGLWYTINTNSYPITVPLSIGRNKGLSEGRLYLSPTGFTVGESGNYWVSITAILQNTTSETVLIPVFLVRDETFDPEDGSLVGGVLTLPTNDINTLQSTGFITNVEEGTRLSLVATNAGYPFPQPINVVSWSISLYKLP